MTTISSNISALSSLTSLYAKSDDGTGTSSSLTQSQEQNIVSMLEGGDSGASSGGLSALLGTSDAGTPSTDLNSILDAIQAQTDATAASATGTAATDGSSSTATTEQQKAATLMQSVYQSQQSNLFTLLG